MGFESWTINELSPRTAPKVTRDLNRDYTRKVEVITDNDNVPGVQVLIGSGISMFSSHPEDQFALCVGLTPEQNVDDPRYWVVQADYTTKLEVNQDGQPSNDQQQHPMDRKGRIRFSGRKYTRAIIRDINTRPIRNSALDPYEHTEEFTHLCIQIQRCLPFNGPFGNVPQFTPLHIERFMGAINSTWFLGFNAYEVLCDDLDAEPKFEQGFAYWDVNVLFVIYRRKEITSPTNPGAPTGGFTGSWLTYKLDAGYRELVDGVWVPIFDAAGGRPSRPVLLDGAGRKMAPGTPEQFVDPKYNVFHTKAEEDFNEIGLLL